MDSRYLAPLRRRYAAYISEAVDPLEEALQRKRNLQDTRLVDLAAIATSLAYVDQQAVDPLAIRAIQHTNPNFDPALLGDYSDQQWMGIVNAAKGKYFEYLVVDRLNQHERVGDLYLPEGFTASVAETMNQPGWDLRIQDETGATADLLQLKATESAGYIQGALERYPEIAILATDEVATRMPEESMVLDSDITETEIEQTVGQTLDGMDQGFLDEFWAAFNPLLPMLVIAASATYSVSIGKARVRSASIAAKDRAARGLAAGAAGALVKVVTDSFLMALPASMLVGWLFDRSATRETLRKVVRDHVTRMEDRGTYLRQLGAGGR